VEAVQVVWRSFSRSWRGSEYASGCWLRSTRGLSLPLATLTCSVAGETNPPYSLVLTSCPALCLAMYPITIGVALTAYP